MSWQYFNYDFDDNFDDDDTLSDYERQPQTIVIDGPLYAASRRGAIGSEWWGQEWIKAMERIGNSGRLERGKRYARNGSVLRLEIGHGIAYAEVSGSRPSSYRSAVHLRILDDSQWEKALKALSEQAIYAAKLLAGEMPGDVEAVFQSVGLSLFPRKQKDIQFECSCPDWGNPCKHCAAVYYLLAEQFDADPFVLFHLRGRSRNAALETLQGYRNAQEPAASAPDDETDNASASELPLLDADLQAFWAGSGETPVWTAPARVDIPFALRQLGPLPGHDLNAGLRDIYDHVAHEANLWLGLDD